MKLIRVARNDVDTFPDVVAVVDELRAGANGFVFLSGGASKMAPETHEQLVHLLDAFALLARRGFAFAVGDGGTAAGLMAAAGEVRRRSGGAFPLLGVAPAPEILPVGEAGTPIEPNHSHIIAVDDPEWGRRQRERGWTPKDGYWGSETEAMYAIFGRLAAGQPSVTVVGNGGSITVDEVRRNVAQRRPLIVVQGSGRAADAILAVLTGDTASADPELVRAAAEAVDPRAHRHLFEAFPLAHGPEALADALATHLKTR